MLFSSTLFLFAFLPLVLALYYALGQRAKNTVLLAASLFFYAWGEMWLVGLMLLSIAANYAFGRSVERARAKGRGRGQVALAVAFNLGLLVLFKYADWIWSSVAPWLAGHAVEPLGGALIRPEWARAALLAPDQRLRLPLGISFFTFQALSYVVDVYRGDVAAQRRLDRFALYIAFFPQLIAGPIVRYRDVAAQIVARTETMERFASGVRRFGVGLGKKVLIANTLGAAAREIFATPQEQVTPSVAWLGIVAYTLQIYFDFSGYSDMAIGLGRLFGFEFIENFAHPYVARSLTEFWRRWHISLSSWFRDYLYVPLGGGRVAPARVYFNLATVFVLCGLWHGASLNYLLFGLSQGAVLILERAFLGARLARWPAAARHAYLLLVWMLSLVIFRCEDTSLMQSWFAALFGFSRGDSAIVYPALYFDNVRWFALAAGAIGSTPWIAALHARLQQPRTSIATARWLGVSGDALLCVVLACCAIELAAGTFNPFIYFRF